MCGRYANFMTEQELVDAFTIATITQDARLLPASWNIAPTHDVALVTQDDRGERTLRTARWGLVPSWAKDASIGARMINARTETVADKPSFRTAFAQRRCLVPASGYYEWGKGPDGKVPYWIHPTDDGPLAFAGLYGFWRDPAGADSELLATCTIVTTAARDRLREIHDRQPVMLEPSAQSVWLERRSDRDALWDAIDAPAPSLSWHAVDRAVGNVRHNSPTLVEAV